MSERYKVIDSAIPTFITLTVVDWIDLFTKPQYTQVLNEALNYCHVKKGLMIHAYVYMTSHIHLVATSTDNSLENIIRDFKRFTSRQLIKTIQDYQDSRAKWLLNKFRYAARRIKRNSEYKLWQDGFHPVVLDSPFKIKQRIDYIHENPAELQLVNDPLDWVNSSVLAYTDEKYIGAIPIDILY